MRRWILPNAHTTNTRGIMKTLTKFTKSEEEIESTYQFIMRRRKEEQEGKKITKDDKQREDRLELGSLFVSIDVSKSTLERIETKIQNSKAETKRLKKIFKAETKKLKKYQNDYKNKSELFHENYGKFRQLRLLIK
jgi:hypothetical protein